MSSSSYQPIFETQPIEPALPAWKMELNAKLAAHRQRKPSPGGDPESASPVRHEAAGDVLARASSVAARVAERYAKAPSYSDLMAASAAAATAAAQTAAFAARQAQDAAESFARLSADRDAAEHASWSTRHEDADETGGDSPLSASALAPVFDDRRAATVEHPQPLPARGVLPPRPGPSSPGLFGHGGGGLVDAFAEAMVPPAVALPAKLIEFPRELVAPRKSRPRIAEGPLVEAPLFDQAEPSSLRIFEVSGEVEGVAMADEPGRKSGELSASCSGAPPSPSAGEHADARGEIASSRHVEGPRSTYSGSGAARPGSLLEQGAPEWQSIRLGEHPVNRAPDQQPAGQGKPLSQHQPGRQAQPLLHTASIADRAMAVLVDLAAVAVAFLLFVLVFAACIAHPRLDKTALAGGAMVLVGLFLFYQWLFMSFGGGTLGMRYARIAICTFEDENPTRQTMRRRVGASVLSLLPLGLGFLWALFDEDSLGWHDRMTRSYQRSYR